MKIEVSWEAMRRRSLYIATPMYGGKCDFVFSDSMQKLIATLVDARIPYEHFVLANESLIQRARNYCVENFMRSGMSHMLFVDADIGFNPSNVLDMLAIADPMSEFDVVCGPYPKKTIAWEKIKKAVDRGFADKSPLALEDFVGDYVFNVGLGVTSVDLMKPFRVQEGGTGFMMIQRHVFERQADLWPEYLYRPDHIRSKGFDGARQIMRYFDCEVDIGAPTIDYYRLVDAFADIDPVYIRSTQPEMEKLVDAAKELVAKRDKSTRRYLSEDYWFCHNVIRSGLNVWMLPWIPLRHMGAFVFGGSLHAMAQLGVPMSADPRQIKKIQS